MSLPKLFIKDSKGKPREWSVSTDGAAVVVQHGLVGGKIVTKKTISKAKNIGKKNETTPEEQALLEAEAKWRKQIDREDYNEDIELAGLQLRPMLARDYTKVGHQVDWESANWLVQPKLDGLRLVYGWRYEGDGEPELLTRKGEVYIVKHIQEQGDKLLEIIREMGVEIRGLDGELYLHGMPLNEINSRAKKYEEGETERLEYHLFDLVDDVLSFSARYNLLRDALTQYQARYGDNSFCLVPTFLCSDEEDMKKKHGKFAVKGYEGIMIRSLTSSYGMAQRPDCLYKYKEFQDEEFRIKGVWEDKNGNAMFECVTEGGKEFNCTPKRTHEERHQMLEDAESYVGKWLKVKFQAWTEYGVPEFPVGLEIRDCDDEGNVLV